LALPARTDSGPCSHGGSGEYDRTRPDRPRRRANFTDGVAVLLIIGALRGGSWVAGLIGVVLLATAYVRLCPAYAALRFCINKDEVPQAK